MLSRARRLWPNLSQSLGFIPGLIVLLFAVLGVVLVEVDDMIDLDGVQFVFKGDGSAARTVLSVIAGSLITVAGLTFSITMVVLQLASSQFSPRILRTFFGDRITQVTIGTYVGTFVYAILVLRAVGSFGDSGFVPRLSVTLASLLGIAAVVLLIVFLNHVSQLVQVSHVTASIAHQTLARIERLFPEPFGESVETAERPEDWRAEPSGRVRAPRPGFVQRVDLDALAGRLAGRAERAAVLVCPGDFVSVDTVIVETWPASAAEHCGAGLTQAVSITSERDIDQDVGFGLRQLTDTALKALSPGINDPATAVTCIGYVRSILVRLTERAPEPPVRRFPGHDLVLHARRREYAEYLESLAQVNRYVDGDAWVAGELLGALSACATAADACGGQERARLARELAATVTEQAARQAGSRHDRDRVQALGADV